MRRGWVSARRGYDAVAVVQAQKARCMSAALAIFAEMVGGSIGTAAAQAVFTRLLKQQISSESDLQLISTSGATNFERS
jgi:hypothetical protein